ncbi:MAG: hypothetical protein DRP41_05065 [Thermodesulfobacteriota bacterium]|nr:MAG: hypothetical protein DRP41_05065 [Thermodesulfobacteriota bacterium]
MQETLDIKDYLQIALRRKWYFIVPFVLISIAAIAYALYAPNIYRASTLILVEPQKVPSSYVKATVTEDIESQLRTITEQIMSRSYLEKIINEFDLYPEMRKKLPLQSVIERMRRCIDVRVRKGRVFTVSFEDQNPVIAMKVANRLASLFIEGNLKVREERAEGTLVFLEKELERVRKLLKQQEKKVSEFRAEHLGVLPEQLEANLRTLDRLQLQLQSNGEALKAAEETRRMLQQQLSQMQTMPMITVDEPTSGEEIVSESSSLSELKAKLKKLRLRYTEKHPEVVRLERLIAQMENEEKSNEANEEGSKETSANEEPLWASQIEAQLAQLDAEISQLKNERKRLKSEIKEYERRVEITPKVEQQLKELSRGYEVTQKEYQSLLDKKLQAELAANMERKQKGERFKVLDQAKIPERPFKPNRQKIILFGVFLGMAIGGGLVGVVEYLDHSFYKIEDLEQFTGISVIASIPKIKAKKLAEV